MKSEINCSTRAETNFAEESSIDQRDFREPYRSQFIEAIEHGAASADIYDVSTGVAYAAGGRKASQGFLKRELERPYCHAANICRWIEHLHPIKRVLDVGGGTAGLSLALAWSFPDSVVDCVDASEVSLRAAVLRIAGHDMIQRIRPKCLPPNAPFPFESECFDLVTCTSVLEFVTKADDRSRLLGEIRRVVRPEGYVLLTTPNPWYPFELHSGRFMGNWRRRQGFPWASTRTWICRQLPGCVLVQMNGRIASKCGLQLPRLLCRAIEPWFPWQFLVFQAHDSHRHARPA